MMKILICICAMVVGALIAPIGNVAAQTIDAESHRSVVAALQDHIARHPSSFPLEARSGGPQTLLEGLRYPYFGYGERKFSNRTDFHPAFDVAYEPLEIGRVEARDGTRQRVRAPQTYLKKVYAIQAGELVTIRLVSSGYKMILKHSLDTPYHDAEGRTYSHFYTSYRHLDERSLDYLTAIARGKSGDDQATYQDLFGKHVFDAGEQIALVGYLPEQSKTPPRAHLDFSLNLFVDPDKGSGIRRYAFNPLLLYPAFEYGNPDTAEADGAAQPGYQFVVDGRSAVLPAPGRDGRFIVQIRSGVSAADGPFMPVRYYALNGMTISVLNGGVEIANYEVNRHLKLGYDPTSNRTLDRVDQDHPHFLAPLGEQEDVFRMGAVLPQEWLESIGYDWSKDGKISVTVSSIWTGYLPGHGHRVEFPLSAQAE